jgi:uncharacterized DUF497 family protein
LPWLWDQDKNRANKRKHGISFETAQLVFDDALAASRLDRHGGEERWHTVGIVGQTVVLVVHTSASVSPKSGEEVGRIISARKATTHERKAYEEGEF